MSKFIDDLSQEIYERLELLPTPTIVRRVIRIDQYFVSSYGRVFDNNLTVFEGNGFVGKAYSQNLSGVSNHIEIKDVINHSLYECFTSLNPLVRLIAADSAFSVTKDSDASANFCINIESGEINIKQEKFRELLVNILPISHGTRVSIIGADEVFVNACFTLGAILRVTDLSPLRFGSEIAINNELSIVVENGEINTLNSIAWSDVAIVTGMCLSTETIDNIIRQALLHTTKLVFNMVTGANLAKALIAAGAHMVIASHFPPVDLPGSSVVQVFLNEQS